MCEPYHSIVQFDDDDDSPRLGLSLGPVGKWLKKIRDFFHISRMGSGHSETLGTFSAGNRSFLLPPATNYEAAWWNRSFTIDGSYQGNLFEGEAYEAALEYANAVCLGSLTSLRRFLEVSIKKTDRPNIYKNNFRKILTKQGILQYEKKIRLAKTEVSSIIKVIIGFTRKRNLLVPEWADDNKLWLPSNKNLLVLPD